MGEQTDTLIKICGMTGESDARTAVSLGADAIGMVFYPDSPRFVSLEQAAGIAGSVGNRALKVGLFVNADRDFVREALATVPLDILQFHGIESQEYCLQFKRPFWKTIHVREREEVPALIAQYVEAEGILLDTWHPTQPGGTGKTFDWSAVEGLSLEQNLILAGGLNPENVGEAITRVRPWAVDVCSGVEASPGTKSKEKMKQFIEEVRRV